MGHPALCGKVSNLDILEANVLFVQDGLGLDRDFTSNGAALRRGLEKVAKAIKAGAIQLIRMREFVYDRN